TGRLVGGTLDVADPQPREPDDALAAEDHLAVLPAEGEGAAERKPAEKTALGEVGVERRMDLGRVLEARVPQVDGERAISCYRDLPHRCGPFDRPAHEVLLHPL